MDVLQEEKQLFPRMLITVTRVEDGRKLEKLFDASHVPIWHQCRGKGTAPSEIMDIFGLSGTTRLITVSFLPKGKVQDLFDTMDRRLSFRQKGGGIALSIPVTGMQGPIFRMLKDEIQSAVEKRIEERTDGDMLETQGKSEYVVIWVSVSNGYSDNVVDAARAAGALGGTVLKGRRWNSGQVSRHLGLAAQEEQEFVMIVVPKEKKAEIMSSISNACGLGTEAHGVVLSLPVDEAIGLEK